MNVASLAGAARSGLSRISFAIGAAALLTAMAADAAAVVGRHVGHPFLGAIELVQACVVVASSSAMVWATLGRAHATVHIVLERTGPKARRVLNVFGPLIGAACFAYLVIGSLWIVHDLWDGREQTELLGLPIAPLRLFWCASAALIVGLFLAQCLSNRGGANHEP
jgi:TRAP-type C4-dicarboxylate transport system permease small subunit